MKRGRAPLGGKGARSTRPLFITFEGPDGAGKSTHARRLAAWLRARGRRVLLTREPGGTPLGDRIRGILLHSRPGSMGAVTELMLYEASRSLLVRQVIRPALKQGKIVILDRFQDSTWVYQGWAGGMDLKLVERIGQAATGGLQPRLTILLDVPAREGLARVRRPNRMEKKPAAFHEKVRSGFLHLARRQPRRFRVIRANRPTREVQEAVRRAVSRVL
ncbi:MAG: dTMP kinase [Candidatus Omnitrophica bacterium]|nr:dTMP kinase [Candidatus Omnitrophota bacterium]